MNAEEARLVAIAAMLTLALGGLPWVLYAALLTATIAVTRRHRVG